MIDRSKWRGPWRGQMEQTYLVRCADCHNSELITHPNGIIGIELAVRLARKKGWSLGSDEKWRCPTCKVIRRQTRNQS